MKVNNFYCFLFLFEDKYEDLPVDNNKEQQFEDKIKLEKFNKNSPDAMNPRNNIIPNSNNFSFNKEILNNNHINLEEKYKKSFYSNLNKSKEMNESVIDLSFYNKIQDGVSGFILLIKEIIKLDSKLESYKQKIAVSEDIELNDIFKYFDKNYKGYFIFEEFKKGIFELEINADSNTLNCVFKLFDKNNDNAISYNEFCEFISPRNNELSAKLRNRVPDNDKEVSEASKSLIINFFRILIDNENKIESIKSLFVKKPSFNISELFQVLRGKIKCFIIKKDVIYFLVYFFFSLYLFSFKYLSGMNF